MYLYNYHGQLQTAIFGGVYEATRIDSRGIDSGRRYAVKTVEKHKMLYGRTPEEPLNELRYAELM